MKVVRRTDRLRAHGVLAVFVTFDDPDDVRRMMLDGIDSPWPVLHDPELHAYRAWGLRRASFADIWLDPNMYRQYGQLLRGGERIRGFGRDRRQLGGDFVVDQQGNVVYSRPQRRDDRPPVGSLVDVVTGL